MSSRTGKLLLVVLAPALVYGAVKAVMYYNAKQTMDDIARAVSDFAELSYADISTEVRGAVTVSGIRVEPRGTDDSVTIDALRISSDDPIFFLRGGRWAPGENAPPDSLAFAVSGARLPVTSTLYAGVIGAAPPAPRGPGPCANGLKIEPDLLTAMGFSEIRLDLDGHYRIDEADRTLDIGMNIDISDIESTQFAATLTDVDVEGMAQGAMPNLNLGQFSLALNVSPEFGQRAVEACAAGSDMTVAQWNRRLADAVLEDFARQGVSLGPGLRRAVRAFYGEWGTFELVAEPQNPVGLLSLMFLQPEQLADALALRLSLNDRLITDTSFTWERPDGRDLSALFGAAAPADDAAATPRPQRRLLRREYESVPVGDIARYVDYQVKIKPRGQPVREGILKRIADGQVEVQQSLHGGKYTVYVPLGGVESMQALIQREIAGQH